MTMAERPFTRMTKQDQRTINSHQNNSGGELSFSEVERARIREFVMSSHGLLSVYSRHGLHARRVANATFYTEGFSSFVASAAASIATGWSEPVPGRV
jgi:hypothetical protein